MKASQNRTPLWTGTFILLLILSVFNYVAGQMTVPLVAKFALTLNDDLTLASTVAGLMSLVSLVVCPFAGLLTDRINRKKLLLFASGGYSVSLLLHSLAANIQMLIELRLLTGVFFSILSVTMVAYSASFIPKERLGEGLGYTALASILAQAVGPAISIPLSEAAGFSATFLAAGVSSALCFAVLFFMPDKEERKAPGERKKFSFHDLFAVEFTEFMLIAILFSSGNGLVSTYLAIVAEERQIANISMFFTVYSVCMVALRPLTGKLLDKKGFYIILIPSILFASLGMVFVGIGYSLAAMIAASVFKALGQGSGVPSLQAHTVKTLDKSRAGVATSTIQIGQNVGNAAAPIVSSFFVKSYGYKAMFSGFGVILFVLSSLILLVYYLRTRNRTKASGGAGA